MPREFLIKFMKPFHEAFQSWRLLCWHRSLHGRRTAQFSLALMRSHSLQNAFSYMAIEDCGKRFETQGYHASPQNAQTKPFSSASLLPQLEATKSVGVEGPQAETFSLQRLPQALEIAVNER
jgi:hypothetical protein